MSRKRSLSEEEHALWNAVTRAIKPLRKRKAKADEAGETVPSSPKAPGRVAKSAPTPAPMPAPKAAPPRIAPPPLAPLERRLKQKLSRGREAPDARIDLHGMTQADAHAALVHFLRRAQRDGARVVLVITGKGGRPAGEPHAERGVLRRQVPHWLEGAELRAFVVGYESAAIGHGGEGALYVRVRRGR